MLANQTMPVPADDLELILAHQYQTGPGWSAEDEDRVAGAVARVVNYALTQPPGSRTDALSRAEFLGALSFAARQGKAGLYTAAPAGVSWLLLAVELIKLLISLRGGRAQGEIPVMPPAAGHG